MFDGMSAIKWSHMREHFANVNDLSPFLRLLMSHLESTLEVHPSWTHIHQSGGP